MKSTELIEADSVHETINMVGDMEQWRTSKRSWLTTVMQNLRLILPC